VRHDGGRIVAVCSARPQRCDQVELQREDIEVLGLDEPRLRDALTAIFGLERAAPALARDHVGVLPIRAGFGLSVLLGFPTAQAPVSPSKLPAKETRGAVLTPTGRFVGPLPEGWSSLALCDLVGADGAGRLAALDRTAAAVAELKRDASTSDTSSGIVWRLPPDATWEQFVFDFKEMSILAVTFRGETRTFEPVDLRLRNLKTKKPNSQWVLLYGFAKKSGRWEPTGQIDPRYQKQKELLSKSLRQAFGIASDPIPWKPEERAFVCRFVTRNSVSVAARRREA